MNAAKPTLPLHLLKQLGAADQGPARPKNGRGSTKHELSRKDRRKEERNQKKAQQRARTAPARSTGASKPKPQNGKGNQAVVRLQNGKQISKKGRADTSGVETDEDEEDESLGSDLLDEDDDVSNHDELGQNGSDWGGFSSEDGDQMAQRKTQTKSAIPKVVKERLADDDAEIAELERKLGIKGRKTLPQSFKDDGLVDLLEDLDGEVVDVETREMKKRKAEADEWLASKRRKAIGSKNTEKLRASISTTEENIDGSDEDMDGLDEESEDLGGASDGGFEALDSKDEDVKGPSQRVRENPYIAPVATQPAAKYVPPFLRNELGSDAELVARIRRQIRGLVNRVTESNLLSAIGDIEKLYRDNPRQHVSSSLVDLILIQICDPTALPDTLLILNAGFATAVYKVIGMDFGAQLIQEVVERFDGFHNEAKLAAADLPSVSKQTSNLITFLSQLYNFQLAGPNLLFDYIRFLLEDLSELNAELLLRIVRMSGPTLRQHDPMALKDIVALIRPAVSKIGEHNLSVRTKYMIETIQDLKNNKMKAGAIASATVAEHGTRIKKILGSLNSRKLKTTEPLRIGLKDIRDSDRKGKWWLVGASWAGPSAGEEAGTKQAADEEASDDESLLLGDSSDGGPDIADLARQQMMNTDVRRSIFVAITLACDYEDAYARISKLRLNKERRKELPFVVMQCCGAEQTYNTYYTLIAKKLCSDRRIKWAFQNSLWKLFRRLGESIFGDDTDDADDDGEIELRRLVNNAKMFGTLVADGSLGLGILKCLNLPYLQKRTKWFVEVMVITVLEDCQSNDGGTGTTISTVFGAVAGAPELARGLQWFLRKVIRKTDLAGGKGDTKRLKEASRIAEKALETALAEE